MLILITRLDLVGNEKPIIINTNDILSIEPDGDEAYVTTSKNSFPISKDTYSMLLASTIVHRLSCASFNYEEEEK